MKNQVQYNEEMDFILSLRQHFKKDKADGKESVRLDIWKQPLESSGCLFIDNDLTISFDSLIFASFVLEFVEQKSLTSFLSIDNTEFIRFMQQYIEVKDLDQIQLYDAFKDYLSNDIAVTDKDYTLFRETIFNTDSFRTRLNEAIRNAFEIFQRELLTEDIKKCIELELIHHQRCFNADPLEYTGFVQTVDPTVSDTQLNKIRLYLLYLSSGVYFFSIDLSYLVFSPEMPESIKELDKNLDVTDFLKAMSDPTRFKLLSKLAQRECFGAELAKELSVSTSTISHHIDRFRKLKLLNLQKGEQGKIYFSLSHQTLERYIDEFKKQVLEGVG